MADIDLEQGRILPRTTVLRWVDMGGGIHAPLISVDGSTVALAEGTEVDLASGAEVDLASGAEVALVTNTGVYLIDSTGSNFGLLQTGNQLRVIGTPYAYQIAEGNIAGHTAVHRHGHNPDVGTAWEAVSHIGAVMYYPTAVETLIVKSDDVDDDGNPADTGARTIYVVGLDAEWALTNDTITMNGTTAVNFNVQMIRVLSAAVLTAGATGTNEGEITIYGSNGSSKIMAIAAGEGTSHSASYSVPAGLTLYMEYEEVTDASLKGANIAVFVREFGGLWHLHHGTQLLDTAHGRHSNFPHSFAEKTDIEWRAKAIAAGAVIGVEFEGWTE